MKYRIQTCDGGFYKWRAAQVIERPLDWDNRSDSIVEVEEWCVDHLDKNLGWYVSIYEYAVYFADERNVIAFKLRWG